MISLGKFSLITPVLVLLALLSKPALAKTVQSIKVFQSLLVSPVMQTMQIYWVASRQVFTQIFKVVRSVIWSTEEDQNPLWR